MEAIIVLILLLLAVPIIVIIWLMVRAIDARNRIEELSQKVDRLQSDLRHQARENAAATPKTKTETTPVPPVVPPDPIFAAAPKISEPAPPPLPRPDEVPPLFSAQKLDEKTNPESAPVPEIITPQIKTEAPPPPIPPLTPPPAAEKKSFEMQLGTYWLVRIGIVMLLTSLAFFGNYAYHNIIGKIGPGGKISLLYLVSGLLLGAGAWWQRRSLSDALKNYAQVLFAGGLAAVYFTTYAAHHIEPLRVIGSATLDGALLLAWAGFIAWLADRRKSEIMALFAIGLAFYSSVITRVGEFTLYSNLILTIAAVVFLVRNRWAGLSFASLATTYAGYTFWRFLHADGWRWATPDEGLWFGAAFLAAYWLVFTAATFLSKSENLSGKNRAAFLTLNNGAFFSLFLLTMLQVHSGGFWKFSMSYGTVLIVLAAVARKFLPTEPLAKNTYLTQGLLLVTLGFITKFAGLQLALVLGAESVMLLILGGQRQSLVLKFFSWLTAALATGWCVTSLKPFDSDGLWTGIGLGALLIFNAVWTHRQGAGKSPFRPQPTLFTLLAFTSWAATTWFNTSAENLPLALAIEAVAFTASIYFLRVREITLFGQFFLVAAQVAWLFHFQNATPPWWNPLAIIVITVGLSHWWQKQKTLAVQKSAAIFYQSIFAAATIALLFIWLHPLVATPTWLALTSLLALAATLYGVVTRAWPLAMGGQIFLIASAWEFFAQLWNDKPEWFFPLAPITALGILSGATLAWFTRQPKSRAKEPLLKIAQVYRWVALALSLFWIWEYVPERQRAWAFMLAGTVVFAGALWKRNREALIATTVYALAALITLWAQEDMVMDIYLPNLISLLALFVFQQILRRKAKWISPDEKIHGAIIFITGVSLWRFVSCWAATFTGGFYLTVTWAGLAVLIFTTGIVLRERFHRWLGLGILAAAVGRVVLVDVWKQETIYRILTFMALGVALLVIGFIYNRYQEKIRQWL